MSSAKQIRVEPIRSADARELTKRLHYSGKSVNNSKVHFGVFLDGRCGGVLQYGPSTDKRKLIHLVKGTQWNEFMELNRMALADWLPKNSESRAISVSLRLLKKKYPFLKWIVTFADGTRCGDGTIYRACGFILTQIVKDRAFALLPDGRYMHKLTVNSTPQMPRPELGGRTFFEATGNTYNFNKYIEAANAQKVEGYQLRYIYLFNPQERRNLTVDPIPYSEIKRIGASMYKGVRSVDSDTLD